MFTYGVGTLGCAIVFWGFVVLLLLAGVFALFTP